MSMYDKILEYLASLGLDWGLIAVAITVFGLVYLAGISGLAKSGDAKRVAGAIAGIAVAALRLHVMDKIPNEELALWLVNAGIAWLSAALLHWGIEIVQAGVKALRA